MRYAIALALLVGCTPAASAGWMPTVIVRARVARAEGARSSAAVEGATWGVSVDARWQLARPPARMRPAPAPQVRLGSRSTPCRVERLCLWERRARRSALETIGRSP
ncbi:MAG: hypothetical protein H6719_24445 [Sandaracinaceae bacterium]|nr:hypothetical protein [Sandaracinaceae bacterium]